MILMLAFKIIIFILKEIKNSNLILINISKINVSPKKRTV